MVMTYDQLDSNVNSIFFGDFVHREKVCPEKIYNFLSKMNFRKLLQSLKFHLTYFSLTFPQDALMKERESDS